MRRRIGAAAAALAVALAVPAAAQAIVIVGTLDQQQTIQTDSKYWLDAYYLAQTFTAGTTGTLNTVTLNLGLPPNVPAVGDFSVEIHATSSGLPTGSALATQVMTIGGGGLYVVVFTTPTSVIAGTQYAAVLVPAAGTLLDWLGNCQTDAYAGGQALVYDVTNDPNWRTVPFWGSANDTGAACQLDFAFATYVTAAQVTPPPNATPPPTATAQAPAGDSRGSALPLLLVTLTIAASALTVRRLATAQR